MGTSKLPDLQLNFVQSIAVRVLLHYRDLPTVLGLEPFIPLTDLLHGRGLHSSTFQLNVSAFCAIGGAFREHSGCILCQKRLRLSCKADECKPLLHGPAQRDFFRRLMELVTGRGLHSFTSKLNLSAFYGIGGARRGCVAHVKGVLGGV